MEVVASDRKGMHGRVERINEEGMVHVHAQNLTFS